MNDKEHLNSVVRHITRVQENCLLLSEKLQDNKEDELARNLIANSMVHDNSKFFGIEWLYLREDAPEDKFQAALNQHRENNLHHPEAWIDGIKSMTRLYIAEFVCDCTARGQEFGSDVRDWLKESALKKYKITTNCKVYKEIKNFLDMLLEKKF